MGSIYMPPTWLVTDDVKLEHRAGVMFARVFLWQVTFFHPFVTLSFGSKTKTLACIQWVSSWASLSWRKEFLHNLLRILLYGILLSSSSVIYSITCLLACLVAQSCLTLCDPMNCSLPGSSLHGIFLAGIPEWVAMLSSKGSFQLRDRTHDSSFTWTAGRFFTHWVIGEAHSIIYVYSILLWNHEYFFDTLNHNPVRFHLFCWSNYSNFGH